MANGMRSCTTKFNPGDFNWLDISYLARHWGNSPFGSCRSVNIYNL